MDRRIQNRDFGVMNVKKVDTRKKLELQLGENFVRIIFLYGWQWRCWGREGVYLACQEVLVEHQSEKFLQFCCWALVGRRGTSQEAQLGLCSSEEIRPF